MKIIQSHLDALLCHIIHRKSFELVLRFKTAAQVAVGDFPISVVVSWKSGHFAKFSRDGEHVACEYSQARNGRPFGAGVGALDV